MRQNIFLRQRNLPPWFLAWEGFHFHILICFHYMTFGIVQSCSPCRKGIKCKHVNVLEINGMWFWLSKFPWTFWSHTTAGSLPWSKTWCYGYGLRQIVWDDFQGVKREDTVDFIEGVLWLLEQVWHSLSRVCVLFVLTRLICSRNFQGFSLALAWTPSDLTCAFKSSKVQIEFQSGRPLGQVPTQQMPVVKKKAIHFLHAWTQVTLCVTSVQWKHNGGS